MVGLGPTLGRYPGWGSGNGSGAGRVRSWDGLTCSLSPAGAAGAGGAAALVACAGGGAAALVACAGGGTSLVACAGAGAGASSPSSLSVSPSFSFPLACVHLTVNSGSKLLRPEGSCRAANSRRRCSKAMLPCCRQQQASCLA
eukprot:3011837-Rhodomonas_salina.3